MLGGRNDFLGMKLILSLLRAVSFALLLFAVGWSVCFLLPWQANRVSIEANIISFLEVVMKITAVNNNVFQLTRLGAFNCYLVREADGLTLVDTGLAGSADGILAAAQQVGQPIKRITLTHAHGDHVGSLDVLANKLPGVGLVYGARTAVFLSGNRTLHANEPQAKLRGSFVASSTQATRLVQDGDTVGSLRVVAAPGHTPDHIAFWDSRDGTLIAGDAFQTKGGLAVAGQLRWLFPFPAMATWHKETAVTTGQKLLTLNPAWLAVGHGNVLENPGAAMAAAIAAAR